LIAASQTAIEGYITHKHLVSGWGNIFIVDGNDVPFDIVADLQPVFDAVRKYAILFEGQGLQTFSISCNIRTVLLHMEDLGILHGSLWVESQDACRCHLCLHSSFGSFPI
jgi:hypothetical protein